MEIKKYLTAYKKNSKAFTLPELMLVVAIAGILMIGGAVKFVDMQKKIRKDRVMAQMKSLQIGLKMYYADVGLFPIAAKAWGLGGYVHPAVGTSYDVSRWTDYLLTGEKPGGENEEDNDPFDGMIDNWCGKYIDNPSILRDPWGHRFIYWDFTGTTLKKSGILCMGPVGVADGTKFGYNSSPGYPNYLRSDGSQFSWKSGTKDSINPPNEEGFSIFPRNGDPDNLETDYILVLWME